MSLNPLGPAPACPASSLRRVALCPIGRSRIGYGTQIAILFTASIAGCAHVPSYQGVGALRPSGENQLVAPTAIRWATCSPAVPANRDISFDGPTAIARPAVAAFSLGAGCVIAGTGAGLDFRAFSGQDCTLNFPEGPRRLSVDAFAISVPPGNVIGEAIAIDMRGTDRATGRSSLYHFDGQGDQPGPVPDDPCPAVAAAGLGPSPSAGP
jgi:hypothetical protein